MPIAGAQLVDCTGEGVEASGEEHDGGVALALQVGGADAKVGLDAGRVRQRHEFERPRLVGKELNDVP